MDEKEIKLSDELLENISMEDLAQLKVEVDDLVNDLKDISAECDEALNS